MIPEIGDKFIINWMKIRKIYPTVKKCNFADREFTILKFSKSKLSTYYLDEYVRCIGISDIIITQKKVAIEREHKLNILGITSIANHHQ